MDNAIIRTTNFTGMDNGVVYYLDSMSPHNVVGRNILTAGWSNVLHLSEDTTLFGAYDGSNGLAILRHSASLGNHVISIGTNKIFDFSPLVVNQSLGLMHTISSAGSGTDAILASNYPDVFITTNNNIIYSSAHHLGIAIKFTATSATSTSLTVSGATMNATYGIDSDAGTNTIFNLTRKEIYTNTTNNPTDTLNFTAAGTTPQAGDEFYVFIDNKFKFNVSEAYDMHFAEQNYPSNWIRQIKLIGSDYWILNGNYVASLNVDEATFSATAKQLPYNTQATCFDENNGMMLVGGDKFGAGRLMLWDTFSDGWLSILNLEKSPSAIKAYKNGWLVIVGSVIYFTDGYQIQELTRCPDTLNYRSDLRVHYNGVDLVRNNILLNASGLGNTSNRAKTGVYIYDTSNGWSYTPYTIDSSGNNLLYGTAGALSLLTSGTTSRVYACGSGISDSSYFVNILGSAGNTNGSVILYYDLPTKIRVNKIELKLGKQFYSTSANVSDVTVTVNYGDGNKTLWDMLSVDNGSNSTTIVTNAGTTQPGEIGQEIRLLNGTCSGERSYIASINNAGTSSESWTISPELSGSPANNDQVVKMNLKKSETKTMTNDSLSSNLTYNVNNFYSDKLYIEVVFGGSVSVDLLGVNIY